MHTESRLKSFLMALLFIISTTTSFADDDRGPKKRQIYREQVLPHAGGRIPDTAFETDRLFLNRLQKEGIAIPDGVVLEQRNPQVYPFLNRDHRKVFRVALSSDGRYIAKDGNFQYKDLPSIETTYLYPQIHDQKITLTPQHPVYPVYKQIHFYNSQLNQPKLQPKKKAQRIHSTADDVKKGHSKLLKTTTSYQNFNFIHDPPGHLLTSSVTSENTNAVFGNTDRRHYLPSYENENLFNEFNHYFNDFELFGPSANGGKAYNNEYTINLPITADSSSNSEQFLY